MTTNEINNNGKKLKGKTFCDMLIMIVSYGFIIIGCVLIIRAEKKNIYKRKTLDVIYTTYESGECSFEKDCLPIIYDNGCMKYYTEENQVDFKCSYLNIVLGKLETSEMACTINHFEKGFNYPEFGEIWYNSTYTRLYDNVNVGDEITVWHDERKGVCVLEFKEYNYTAGIILLVTGLIFVLSNCGNLRKNKVYDHDDSYKKKSTNFVNVENVENV